MQVKHSWLQQRRGYECSKISKGNCKTSAPSACRLSKLCNEKASWSRSSFYTQESKNVSWLKSLAWKLVCSYCHRELHKGFRFHTRWTLPTSPTQHNRAVGDVGIYQALQVCKERNWWAKVRVQSFVERGMWQHHALCVREYEQGETGIPDILTYWDDWIGQILSFKLCGLFVRKRCLQKENKPNQLRQKGQKPPISPRNQVFLIISITVLQLSRDALTLRSQS